MKTLKYAALTHPGKVRTNNEDNLYINGKYRKNVDKAVFEYSGVSNSKAFIAAVFDGMGGEADGEVASLFAVETLDKYIRGGEYGGEHKDAFPMINEANDRICDYIRQENRRMGTTLAILNFRDDKVDAINIGDSRIYCLDKNGLNQLSVDHTTVGSMVRSGQITKEEAKTHKLRHQLLQHLGIFQEEMMLEPAMKEDIQLEVGMKFLICSDGLTDMVSDEEIENVLSSSKDVNESTITLRDMALERGGKDNTTVLIVEVEPENSNSENESESNNSLDIVLACVLGCLLLVALIVLGVMIYNNKTDNDGGTSRKALFDNTVLDNTMSENELQIDEIE